MKKQYTIYKATSPDGKSYVGCTSKSLEVRIYTHKSAVKRTNFLFKKALKKYDDKLKWVELESVEGTLDEAYIREEHWIKKLKTKHPNGYNLTEGGRGMKGFIFNKEMRKKMSDSHKGYKATEIQKKRIGIALRKSTTHKVHNEGHTEKAKKKNSDAHLKLHQNKEYRKNYMEGRKKIRKPIVDQYGKIYQTQQEAADKTKNSKGNVNNVLKGRFKQTKGFTFKYVL